MAYKNDVLDNNNLQFGKLPTLLRDKSFVHIK